MTRADHPLYQVPEPARAARVAAAVNLQEITLRQVDAMITASQEDVSATRRLLIQTEEAAPTYEFLDQQRVLTVNVPFQIRVLGLPEEDPTKDAEPRPLFQLRCQFGAVYEFLATNGPEKDEQAPYFAAFARLNGSFNVWPYIRELVQTTGARMGLPPITIPVRRLPTVPAAPAPAATSPAPAPAGSLRTKRRAADPTHNEDTVEFWGYGLDTLDAAQRFPSKSAMRAEQERRRRTIAQRVASARSRWTVADYEDAFKVAGDTKKAIRATVFLSDRDQIEPTVAARQVRDYFDTIGEVELDFAT